MFALLTDFVSLFSEAMLIKTPEACEEKNLMMCVPESDDQQVQIK